MAEQEIIERIVNKIIDASVDATPRVIVTLVFLIIALLFFRKFSSNIENIVSEISENKRDRKIISVITKCVIGLILTTVVLFMLGFQEVATVLGTLSGIIILASSYALKQAIRELVAGVYLIHDENFVSGNKVTASGVTGYVYEVGLRRTKIEEEDGDITTISNTKIEPKWTYHEADPKNE